jgi:peptidoglycan-associated lipoprotein
MIDVRLTVLATLCAALLTVSCAKKAVETPQVPPQAPAETPAPPPPPPVVPAAQASVAPPTEDDLFARKSLDALNAERPLGAVQFDLDSFTIRDDARMVLQRNADWLRRWPSTRIVVEGHCDDRGSSEYNLALGDRRALAVKTYLVSLGIASERVDTVSKGKEAPLCTMPDESCWQQNRRGHSIVTAK